MEAEKIDVKREEKLLMRKQLRKIKMYSLIFLGGGILFLQCILIAVCNIKLIDNNIDCDNAKLFVHVMEMVKQGRVAIPNWSYTTTLEWDCSSLFALPIYAITKNIYLSFGIANILFLIIFIGSLFYLFNGKNFIYPIFAANLICIPYSLGMLDYFNMMFFCGSQYILKVLLPIMFIAILVNSDVREKSKIAYSVFTVAFIIFFAITSISSGIYVFATGIMPVLCVYLIWKLIKFEKIPVEVCTIAVFTVIMGVLGIYFNQVIMGEARGNGGMVLISIYQVLANVSSCLSGIFELFGGATYDMQLSVFTIEGIDVVVKICVIVGVLICGGIAFCRIVKKQSDMLITLLFSVFAWNLFVLLITNTRAGSATYEYRYHLIGMIPLLCVTSIILLDGLFELNEVQKKVFITLSASVLIVINIFSFSEALNREDKQAELKALCEYCNELELEYVYLYDGSNDADMCRLISESESLYLCVVSEGKTWAYDFYSQYVNGDISSENAILVVDNEKDFFGETFEAFGFKFEKFDTVANRSLYRFVN